jgi:hypothetical protein
MTMHLLPRHGLVWQQVHGHFIGGGACSVRRGHGDNYPVLTLVLSSVDGNNVCALAGDFRHNT